MIQIGVVGYGYWGPNLVRNFAETPGVRVSAVSDLNSKRLAVVAQRYPGVNVMNDALALIEDPSVDAVVIATPVSTHFELAMAALKAGKHVLVEKPLTASSVEALRLLEAADKAKRVLMVDHTFVYTSAVRKIRDMVALGDLGRLYYYDSVRVNLGLFQHDVNVIWDLAVHDLAIMDYLLPTRPYGVSATGMSHLPGRPENIAYLTFLFEDNLIAHIHVNWLAPVKIRRTLIGGSRKMVVYDDVEPSEKIKVYDKGISVDGDPDGIYKMMVNYRAGDMWAPHLDLTEALRTEAAEFVRCISTGAKPITSGEAGLRVVGFLEAATQSMKQQGKLVELPARKESTA
ncbi:MAG: Gfo/Idh/MocA family oxidoreductase [Bryobacteraceae bacterium]